MNNVIIVAGGKGQRMESELPKQFIPINGKPILMHTIKAFHDFDNSINIVVVLAVNYRKHWIDLCEKNKFNIPHLIAEGGESRFHSVKNGLSHVQSGYVAVHDAARPFVSKSLISKTFESVRKYQAVIPVINVTDSLRWVTEASESRIVDRSQYRLVQTPQVFSVDVLKKSYNVDFNENFTDDSSVVESAGYKVHLIKGDRRNIKITTPFDLELAKVIISS